MKIAMYFNLPSGGAKRAVYEWTSRLSKTHLIDVYTLNLSNHDFCDIRPIIPNYKIYPFSTHRLYNRPLGRLNKLQYTRDLHSLARLHRHIAAQIDAAGYDLLFAHSDFITFAPLLLQFSKTPSVYYLHEPFGYRSRSNIERPYHKERPFWEALNKVDPFLTTYQRTLSTYQARSLKAVTRPLANSAFTQEKIRQVYGIDAPVCYCGVDSEQFYPMPEICKENQVISVGEMAPRKGFDFLVRSIGIIPENNRPQLMIASNFILPNELAYIQKLAEQYHVQLNVQSHLNTDHLREEYNRSLLCVYSPVNEPLGLVPLEAMACGTPVIGVAEGGVKETVRDQVSGVLVPRDPSQFASVLADLLKDHDRLASLQAQARAYILDDWTWDQSVSCLENHFQAVVNLATHPTA